MSFDLDMTSGMNASGPAFNQVITQDAASVYNAPQSSAMNSAADLLKGDSVFSGGLMTLYLFMQMLSDQANGKYASMNEASEKSREAQKHLTAIDGLIAKLSASGNNGAKEPLPEDVIKYIEDNHLEISGVCGYVNGEWQWQNTAEQNESSFSGSVMPGSSFVGGGSAMPNATETKPAPLDQAQLNAVKGALENVANRASDFVSSSQLQLQKLMQTYNVSVSLINSLQTMLADMNKTIAQGIR